MEQWFYAESHPCFTYIRNYLFRDRHFRNLFRYSGRAGGGECCAIGLRYGFIHYIMCGSECDIDRFRQLQLFLEYGSDHFFDRCHTCVRYFLFRDRRERKLYRNGHLFSGCESGDIRFGNAGCYLCGRDRCAFRFGR